MTRLQTLQLLVQIGISVLLLLMMLYAGWRRHGLRRTLPPLGGMAIYLATIIFLHHRYGSLPLWILLAAAVVLLAGTAYSFYPNWAPYFGFTSTRLPKDLSFHHRPEPAAPEQEQ
ncbi:MAG: hypothetical protein IPO52_06345 [Gemmatimonadetes bacterium]|jgi:hypothetical protein|nr:hypothetical protein [Gemmatimonadota bacterium]MBK9548718.1 hypothetical protein [Gemmatimonadota bacterium]MBP9898210.1 hypothetical protein [Gemmatimonadales bacterium]